MVPRSTPVPQQGNQLEEGMRKDGDPCFQCCFTWDGAGYRKKMNKVLDRGSKFSGLQRSTPHFLEKNTGWWRNLDGARCTWRCTCVATCEDVDWQFRGDRESRKSTVRGKEHRQIGRPNDQGDTYQTGRSRKAHVATEARRAEDQCPTAQNTCMPRPSQGGLTTRQAKVDYIVTHRQRCEPGDHGRGARAAGTRQESIH